MSLYNGAIKVINNNSVNIPEPGIVRYIASGAGYSGAKGDPVITDVPAVDVTALKLAGITGGDVIYMVEPSPNEYVLEIKNIQVDAATGIGTIFLNATSPSAPAADFTGVGVNFTFYKGNYQPTNDAAIVSDGYTGAGTSPGYSLTLSSGVATTADVLTVNNDRVTVTLEAGKVNDLQVVKLFESSGQVLALSVR